MLYATGSEIAEVIDSGSSAFSNIAETMDKYGFAMGIAIILVVLICIMFYVMQKSIIKNITDQMNTNTCVTNAIINTNEKLIDKVTDNKDDENKEEKKEEKPNKNEHHITADQLNKYINLDYLSKVLLKQTQENLDCDRVSVYAFHNGNKSLYGFPFFKMSCLFESCKKGSMSYKTTSIRLAAHKDLPFHAYINLVKELYEKNIYYAANAKLLSELDESLERYLDYSSAKSIFFKAIKDDNNGIAGFVTIEYEQLKDFELDSDEYLKFEEEINNLSEKFTTIMFCTNHDEEK